MYKIKKLQRVKNDETIRVGKEFCRHIDTKSVNKNARKHRTVPTGWSDTLRHGVMMMTMMVNYRILGALDNEPHVNLL